MSTRNLLLVIMGTSIGILGFVVGGVVTSENTTLAKNASAEPEVVRLADLGSRPIDANRHLKLTQFGFGHDYLYRGAADKWDRTWIPLIDPASTTSQPKVQAVVVCRRVKNIVDYAVLKHENSFQGMNVTGVNLIPSELQQQLAGFYPGHDFSKIPVFEEGAAPPTENGLVISQSIMMVSLAIGLISLVAWVILAKWHSQGAHAAVA